MSEADQERINKDKKKEARKRRQDIEAFILFDIDKNNSTPNPENQRLL